MNINCNEGSLSTTIFFLVYNAVAVIIGVVYKKDCNNGADFYLTAAGGLGLAVSVLTLLVILIMKHGCKDKDVAKMCFVVWFLRLAVNITQVIIMFWGFGAIFPKYANWGKTTDKESDDYCPSVPMMFAFVILTIKCIIFIIISLIVSCCFCCCAASLAAFFGKDEKSGSKA